MYNDNDLKVTLLITVGGYDSSIHCWKVTLGQYIHDRIQTETERYFSAKHHSSFIRGLTCACFDSSLLVSYGADELLNIYDGRKKILVGNMPVDGDVSSLHLCDRRGKIVSDVYPYELFGEKKCVTCEAPCYAIATTMNGFLYVWKIKSDWEPIVILQPHMKKCTDISLHPTGNLGLSVGDDKMISIIDMGKGKVALTIKHHGKLEKCRFSGISGDNYVLTDVKEQEFLVIETETNKTVRKIASCDSQSRFARNRVCNVRFIDEKHFLCVFEDGTMKMFNIHTGEKVESLNLFPSSGGVRELVSESNRLLVCKDFFVVHVPSPCGTLRGIIAAISTSGIISLVGIRRTCAGKKFIPIQQIHEGTLRATCITASLLRYQE